MGQRLGQHFLKSSSILERIAVAACPEPEPLVIEIGPGKGSLTKHLLAHAERVVAIELDRELATYLTGTDPRLTVVPSDVLDIDMTQWGPAVVAGNLPYYITSPIIEKTLALGPILKRAIFLIQKEVALRLVAKPGTRDYGYLSVATQITATVEYLFTISPGSFTPPPKVDSAVIRLTPREPLVPDAKAFLSFASACFRQKRKNLRNNLGVIFDKNSIENQPEATLRAEQLSIPQLIDLYNRLR
jgi:16S rRNA (adenine1518-N6/adenine1519-N6)-dimethyltransferase